MNSKSSTSPQPWWKTAAVYQIYPKSFQDSNGDGIGDLPGIISRLDYLSDLGIDAIWLSPVFCSPQADNGYDISDYCAIDPIFGTMEDMDRLIEEAGRRGIRILMDLVLNHSSDEHRWFLEARKSRENPYHDYYLWRDKTDDLASGKSESAFDGSLWEWVPEIGQYYYHQFSAKQPDLNWENAEMRHALYKMIRWWTARGIGGYRLDVVDHLGKDPEIGVNIKGPKMHERIREMSRECFQGNDFLTVGEAWSATVEDAKIYSNPDGSELSMVFSFEHIKLDQQAGKEKWDLAPLPFVAFKRVICRWQKELSGCGWNSLFWENHDLPRIVSRWGDDKKYPAESAKMLAVALLGLQGTPYIYQGQELGMTNVAFPLEEYHDIETVNLIRKRRTEGFSDEEILRSIRAKGRDNARTPMQWDQSENAGFTGGTPWIKVNPNYRHINAALQQRDEYSTLSCYKRLLRLRRELSVFTDGAFDLLLEEDEELFAYTRTNADTRLLVICNFYGNTVTNPLCETVRSMRCIFCTAPEGRDPALLRPYEARIYLS